MTTSTNIMFNIIVNVQVPLKRVNAISLHTLMCGSLYFIIVFSW